MPRVMLLVIQKIKKGDKEEEVVEEFDKYVSPQMNIQGS